MDVYIYAADIYCKDCGKTIQKILATKGCTPNTPDDQTSYDSDEYPKGPYSDGGASQTAHNIVQVALCA